MDETRMLFRFQKAESLIAEGRTVLRQHLPGFPSISGLIPGRKITRENILNYSPQ